MDPRLALAAGSALLFAACGVVSTPTATEPPPPSTTPAAPGVVPWADLPAAHEPIPAATAPPSPDPALAAATPYCRGDQLGATLASSGAAAGTDYWTYAIRLLTGPSCHVDGVPTTAVVTDGGQDVPVQYEAKDSGAYGGPVLVSPTSTASIRLGWGSDWCSGPLTVTAVELRLPDGTLRLPGVGSAPACDNPGSSDRAPLMVWPVQPERFRLARVVSPWDGVRFGIDPRELRGTRGSTIDFVVTLTARRPLSLATCPDFELDLFGYDATHTRRHQLDCAAVPYTQDGTPYLPADTPVRFAMRLTVPDDDTSTYKVWWHLAADPDATDYGVGTVLWPTG